MASSASSSSAGGTSSPSPPSPAVPVATETEQSATTPISAALAEGVANLDQNADNEQDMQSDTTAAYAAHAATDGDSEQSFWDIIADSHTKLESYGDLTQAYGQEIADSVLAFTPQTPSTATTPPTALSLSSSLAPSTNLPMAYDDYQQQIGTNLIGSAGFSSVPTNSHVSYSGFAAPSHYVTFEPRQDGTAFPLSKPIIREDGLLLVGTELIQDTPTQAGEKNRILVTNFLSTTGTAQTSSHILVEEQVRDIHWISTQAAIVAIGKEIHLIQLGDPSVGGSCRLQDPINTVHSAKIREIAISPSASSYVLSGSFDETVVVTDLRNHGNPKSSTVIGKYNAHDAVSSVRWSPVHSHLSWTTDGGDFQLMDTRVHSPQLHKPLYMVQNLNRLGGLFTHEYLSDVTIALGFERGSIAFIDTRMPRETYCTSVIESTLSAVGEIRRSKTDKLAIFGCSGFATADLNGTTSSLEHITLRQPSHQIPSPSFKTSGDFSYERGAYLAVSDNAGVVSVYTDDTTFGSAAFGATSGGWPSNGPTSA